MISKCSSANRCAQIHCSKCAKRHARRVAREFQAPSTCPIYAVTIAAQTDDLEEFGRWRADVWNIIAYRRQICRWWRGVSLRVWLCQDQTVRGVVALGAITESEFQTALGSRWFLTLHPIPTGSLADLLFQIVRPGSIMADDPGYARYQHRQMTVRPSRARAAPEPVASVRLVDLFDEPMPMLIG
jgi:hypothetical protein